MKGEKRFPEFEVGVMRHAPKVDKPKSAGEAIDVRHQSVDRAEARPGVETTAQRILERLEVAPEGAIMALEPSNVGRAMETRDMLAEALREKLTGREDIELVTLGKDENEVGKLLGRMHSEVGRKFIIADVRGTWLIGMPKKDPAVNQINKWKNQFSGNEELIAMLWAARKEELPKLRERAAALGIDITDETFAAMNPSDFELTPEEAALRQIRWMQAMKRIGQKHFPGRPLILEGVSHNIRSDYASLLLLSKDLSMETIERDLGGHLREPFERSSVKFFKDSSVEVAYRDMHARYSADEFERVLEQIRKKSKERKTEWGIKE